MSVSLKVAQQWATTLQTDILAVEALFDPTDTPAAVTQLHTDMNAAFQEAKNQWPGLVLYDGGTPK